jgi:hypothetical protein
VLKQRASACEKRSVDEVAIDITEEADRILACAEKKPSSRTTSDSGSTSSSGSSSSEYGTLDDLVALAVSNQFLSSLHVIS